MKVILSGHARQDLFAIGDFIVADNPKRARSFVMELRAACLDLAEAPFRFAQLDGFEAQGYRRRVFGNYLIIYRVTEAAVIVLRVVSGALDVGAIAVPRP
jgi:toxin ParE1/3/4